MIIEKKSSWSILSLAHIWPIVNSLIRVGREIKVTIVALVQIARMIKLLLLVSKSENKTKIRKNDKILAKSSLITIKK